MQDLGTALELGRGPVVADPTSLDHVRRPREPERDVGELLDQEDADPALRHRGEDRDEALDDQGCESERQLVDEHDLGAGHEGLGEHDHLLLPARERARRRLPAALERWEQLERVVDPLARLRPAERVRGDPEVVLHGELSQEAPSLRHDRDTGGPDRLGAPPCDLLIADEDAAGGGAEDAADRQHERRLARAVRAEQRGDRVGRDLERHVADDRPAARDGERLEPERGRSACVLHLGRRAHSSSAASRGVTSSSVPR